MADVDGASPSSDPMFMAIADLPQVRQEHSVVALGEEIVVIGGFTPTPSGSMFAYNPGTDSWRALADFPFASHHLNAAVVGDSIYVIGYYPGSSFSPVGEVHRYDSDTDSWTMLDPVPGGMEVGASAVGVIGSTIYIAGGARGPAVSDFMSYDTADGSFEALPPLPGTREHTAGAVINGVLYVAGGRNLGLDGFTADTLAFDPAVGEWQVLAPIPTPRGGVAGAALDGKLYIFGGEGSDDDPDGVFPDAEVYDPGTDSWQALPPMDSPRHGFGAATLGGKIYLPGGADTELLGAVADCSVFTP